MEQNLWILQCIGYFPPWIPPESTVILRDFTPLWQVHSWNQTGNIAEEPIKMCSSCTCVPYKRIEHGFPHNVLNLDDITSPLQILNLDNVSESYDSKLRCRFLWDTLYSYCSGPSLGLLRFRPVLRCYYTDTITTVKDWTIPSRFHWEWNNRIARVNSRCCTTQTPSTVVGEV